ncbi:hypothetical protein ACFX10_034857 [Malus domestica]
MSLKLDQESACWNSDDVVFRFPWALLTSDQPNRDEVDYEFLGNVEGKQYVLQTNIFADGLITAKRGSIYGLIQQRISIPIPYYEPSPNCTGVAFPTWQPMSIKASLWNGDSWATRGGRDKIDWSKGPFTASLRNHKIDACVWKGNARFCRA